MTFKEFLQKTGKLLKDNKIWITETYFDPKTHEPKKRDALDRYSNDNTFSITWSLGGTRGNYSSEKTQVYAELEPQDPIELDLILENICPSLQFMQYKAITREVMERGEIEHSDYYGGSCTEAYKGFKIKALFKALNKRNLLE